MKKDSNPPNNTSCRDLWGLLLIPNAQLLREKGMDTVRRARDEGNFVAIELKRKATAKRGRDAFRNLAQMKRALKYPLTVFVNVDSEETHAELCPKRIAVQTVCFSVRLDNGKPVLKAQRPALHTQKKT